MSTDPHARQLLQEHLVALARETGATGALITDEEGWDYANAFPFAAGWEQRAEALWVPAVAALGKHTLNRGGHVHLVHDTEAPLGLIQSFATVYLLALWFDEPFDGTVTRVLVRRALPAIESLLMHLPPEEPGRARAVKVRG